MGSLSEPGPADLSPRKYMVESFNDPLYGVSRFLDAAIRDRLPALGAEARVQSTGGAGPADGAEQCRLVWSLPDGKQLILGIVPTMRGGKPAVAVNTFEGDDASRKLGEWMAQVRNDEFRRQLAEYQEIQLGAGVVYNQRPSSLRHLTRATRYAVRSGNLYAALALALALPDICGYLEFGRASQKRFVDWYNRYLLPKYSASDRAILSGEDCYALRCAFLHQGSEDITSQRARQTLSRFLFMVRGRLTLHATALGDHLTLLADQFCEDVCESVEQWERDTLGNAEAQTRLADLLTIHQFGGVEAAASPPSN